MQQSVMMELHSLNISDNYQLTGSIPSEIGNLTNLTYLNLGVNNLTGSIPPEIGNLTNLTDLCLGYNQLTGEIPESICDLDELNYWISIEHPPYGNMESWITYSNFSQNQLCPPYASCIEDYVGNQDTRGCD